MSTASLDLLRKLIAFDTTSVLSNLSLIDYVRQLLASKGIVSEVVFSEDRRKANLFASVGPRAQSGILLSGHTDVVPVAGQQWSVPAFEATVRDGRVYGRGACDMKGFVACALAAMLRAADKPLRRPLQLALSYDEETGCVGVRRLLDLLQATPLRPMLCVVGEPTQMRLAVGHKGKTSLKACCHGHEGHSSLAPNFPNAIHLAATLVDQLRREQQRLAQHGAHDPDYDVPYSTVHVGRIDGGTALNIVPNLCQLEFEIRSLPGDNTGKLVDQLREQAERIAQSFSLPSKQARIEIDEINSYPGLNTSPTVDAVHFLSSLLPAEQGPMKVAFGTEGGLFAQRLDVPVVVCGPGSIEQAHQPDEYVALEQLAACDVLLDSLLASLC
ncbi:acetylornithine deacetylase [Pseudomonas asiatica]|uniref:acetylornithine deacetylase n=1 Tax=Pseudomonas asiatica TaxID=2219225 RepID=UPI0025704C0F|nr:acetylornithine deacetylase [Pseudomonas asiatica]WJD72197.1 acetylornithine deacetylase [Pseudomonas asiatica]